MEKELTFGEKLVGLTFNPSGDEKVQKVKELFAEILDIVEGHKQESYDIGTFNSLRELLYNNSLIQIINAQTSAVKLLTFK